MFICSMRASTLKFFGIIAAGVAALVLLLVLFPAEESAAAAAEGQEGVNYENVKTNDDRTAFLLSLGYTVEPTAAEETRVTIPQEFDHTMTAYNELQKETGLDLTHYRGKEAELYSYVVNNYPDYDGRVYANLLVYRGRVIGGDISSGDVDGFMHGLRPASNS